MSSLPKLAGKLAIDFQDDFYLEKSLHTNERYLSYLKSARSIITENTVCCYCGFPDHKFLEVHHVNGDHDDYSKGNTQYICTLCHRLCHLGWVGVSNLGKIIHLPSVLNDNSRFWLEPFHHLQRFYLMQDTLSSKEQVRLKSMPLTQDIVSMQTKLKSQDVGVTYDEAKIERSHFLAERARLERLVGEEKQKALEEIRAERESRRIKRENKKAGNEFADLHILELLDVIMNTGEKNSFLNTQDKGIHGRTAVWFNLSVLEPFEPSPEYTLEERLEYYNRLDYFSPNGLGRIMHNLRNQ